MNGREESSFSSLATLTLAAQFKVIRSEVASTVYIAVAMHHVYFYLVSCPGNETVASTCGNSTACLATEPFASPFIMQKAVVVLLITIPPLQDERRH